MDRKKKTSIALDEELLSWIDKLIKAKRFANRTHAIEYALQRLKEREKENSHLKGVKNEREKKGSYFS